MTDFRHTVTIKDNGKEVKDILKMYFDFSSRLRNRIKREDLVLLNGSHTQGWYRVKAGDEILVCLPEETSSFMPQAIPLMPVFEDDDLLILNKQPGLIVHPTKGHPAGTAANALMYYQQQNGQSWKIRFVNRLDMDTSGLLVVAKNAYCQNGFMKQMKAGMVRKSYIAIVQGLISENTGTLDLPVGRPDPANVRRGVMDGGSPSVTHYKVIERFHPKPASGGGETRAYTLIELLLETGRTHQIRVHMSYIGHPVLGDHLYGGENVNLIERQALHAAKLEFIHPVTGQAQSIEAPMPADMKKAIEKLR